MRLAALVLVVASSISLMFALTPTLEDVIAAKLETLSARALEYPCSDTETLVLVGQSTWSETRAETIEPGELQCVLADSLVDLRP